MYRRIFFSKTTIYVASALILLSSVLTIIIGTKAQLLNTFDYFDVLVNLILCAFLLYGNRTHDLLVMQAGTCGLLVAMVYDQANYVFNDLFSFSAQNFINLGFWGSFYLATELLFFLYSVILTLNHFFIFVLNKTSFLRIAVSQVAIIIILIFILFQLFVITQIAAEPGRIALFAFMNCRLFCEYIFVACTQLILVIDENDGGIAG